MRKPLFRVRHLAGYAALALLLNAGFTSAQDGASAVNAMLSQPTPPPPPPPPPPPCSTWEDHLKQLLRQMYQTLGGDLADLDRLDAKSATMAVQARLTLFGLPSGLNADALASIENHGVELANVADWNPPPPEGTSYGLIVLIHDLGKTIVAMVENY
ncbi:MAG: hypothetical protein K2Q09_06950 [Phycisphaerales bacterium]|nr:hypothetical protein [Phycisphaerales bacterium]